MIGIMIKPKPVTSTGSSESKEIKSAEVVNSSSSSSSGTTKIHRKKIQLAEVFGSQELNNPDNAKLFLAIKWINSVLNDDAVDETGLPADIRSNPKGTVTSEYRDHFTIEHKNLFRAIRTFIINTYCLPTYGYTISFLSNEQYKEYRSWIAGRKLPSLPEHELDILTHAIKLTQESDRNPLRAQPWKRSVRLRYVFTKVQRKDITIDEKGCDAVISKRSSSQTIDTSEVENLLENNAVFVIDSVDSISRTGFGTQTTTMLYTWTASFENTIYSPHNHLITWDEIFHNNLTSILSHTTSSSKTSDSHILKQLPKQNGCKFHNSDTVGYTLAYSPSNGCAILGRVSTYHFFEERFQWEVTSEQYQAVVDKHVNKYPSFWNKHPKFIPTEEAEIICSRYFES